MLPITPPHKAVGITETQAQSLGTQTNSPMSVALQLGAWRPLKRLAFKRTVHGQDLWTGYAAARLDLPRKTAGIARRRSYSATALITHYINASEACCAVLKDVCDVPHGLPQQGVRLYVLRPANHRSYRWSRAGAGRGGATCPGR